MQKRLIALGVVVVALVLVAALVPRSDGGVRVQAGGDPTTTLETTTTQTPVTTPVPTDAPTTAPTTSTTVTTEPPTTVPPTDPPTTAAPEPPATVAAEEATPQAMPDKVVVQEPAKATRSGPVCTTDEEYCNPPSTPPRAEWRYCEQWHDLAAAVGWPESEGPTLSYVMHRESGCDPNARNRSSGAAGLLQLLGHNCNGSCFDPENNLRTGLALYHNRRWCDWVLRGDPVTGHACG